MSDLNDNMQNALRKLYYNASYVDWVYPDKYHGSWLDGRTGAALERRGLCTRNGKSYALTDEGFEYCRALQLTVPFEPSEQIPVEAFVQKQLETWTKESPNFNPQTQLGYWQLRAQRAQSVAIDWSHPGGMELNRKMMQVADGHQALVNIVSSWSLN